MHIRLMAHVEHQSVLPGVKHRLQSHAQLHHPQIGGQVSAGLGYGRYQKFPNFPAKGLPVHVIEPLEVAVAPNGL